MTRRFLIVAALCLALAVALTWPLALHPSARLGAPVGAGDPFLNLWILGWDLGTLTQEPLALLTGRIFQANIFYPADLTLAYSDHLIPQAVVLWPLYAVTRDVVLCYNVLLVGSLVASALAMFAFITAVTGSPRAGFIAAVAWGFGPYHFAHLLHVQLQALYVLPLSFLCLHRLLAARRRADAVWLGAAAALQAVSAAYYGVIGGLALASALAVLAFATGQWRSRVLIARLALAALVALVLVLPFVWPYWEVQQQEGFTRTLYEAGQHAARAGSYLQAPPLNLLYGRTGLLASPAAGAGGGGGGEAGGPERELFPGFALIALAALGTWRSRRRAERPLAWSFIAIGIVGFVLSLGPDGIRPLYAALHQSVFGFQAIRAPARFGVLVLFALACLAGLAVKIGDDEGGTRRAEGGARRVTLYPVLLAFIVLEYVTIPLPTVPAPRLQTAVGAWLRTANDPGAVVYLPLDLDAANTLFMVQSLEHRRPIVNGYSGQRPPFFVPVVEALRGFPSAESLWMLHDLNVRFVVSPSPVGSASPLVERARLEGGIIYELRWTPDVERALPRPYAAPPPPPGPVPFAAGETAVYQVAWNGAGPAGLPAGAATFRVVDWVTDPRRPEPSDEPAARAPGGFKFELRVETAPWVARFFDARDAFETWADAALAPVAQHQHLREGRRVVDRLTRFDARDLVVETAGGVRLPMAPGSRDALAAFYYARAVPLGDGATLRIPVNEGGRNLVVEVTNKGPASVEQGGGRREATRLEARVQQRIERRRPIEATVWLSRDARRIPLVVEVTTGFGEFRAALVTYTRR